MPSSKLNVAILVADAPSAAPYHHNKTATQRTSHKLAVAIREAIQAHADTQHSGKLDLEKILSALGEVSSDFLSEIPDIVERGTIWAGFMKALMKAVDFKSLTRAEATLEHRQQ